ncbi:hypothetical protein [Micromonospora tulbaghiae]|uniref:hypothetical protein n=1 Tax=Micromonospora tulbaghiae TaxID=479978 RepID=UPI0033F61D46
MSQGEITTLVTALGDIATVLRNADPADKAEVYRQLGLRLNYQPETQTVRAEVDLSAHRGVIVCVRGVIDTVAPHHTTPAAEIVLDDSAGQAHARAASSSQVGMAGPADQEP